MPLASKIFEVKPDVPLEEIAEKLKDYRVVEEREEEGMAFELITEVRDLDLRRSLLEGVFSKDKIILVPQRGKNIPVIKTTEARIIFRKEHGTTLLTIVQEKHFANAVASLLSNHLFLSYRSIVEARISPEVMRAFHEKNPENTKVIYFDDLDIPEVSKLALYGESVKNSALYEEYLRHGKVWYIVYQVPGTANVMGLTRNCVVTSFTKMDESDFINYIYREIHPLIYQSMRR
ncbi:MAG: hypothetical protein NZ929_00755 [Aigarchaeota archaeon]|nr:hypothetical protein [Aigarchaeota archaeon]MCX8193201.1 hypothetical protein [Nitrososphaeria archaeon]MDW7986342.1 hypothetical protein [Nitrososphaerota archaeon]